MMFTISLKSQLVPYTGSTKKTLVHLLYSCAKSRIAMKLKVAAISVNIIWSWHAKNLVITFFHPC